MPHRKPGDNWENPEKYAERAKATTGDARSLRNREILIPAEDVAQRFGRLFPSLASQSSPNFGNPKARLKTGSVMHVTAVARVFLSISPNHTDS